MRYWFGLGLRSGLRGALRGAELRRQVLLIVTVAIVTVVSLGLASAANVITVRAERGSTGMVFGNAVKVSDGPDWVDGVEVRRFVVGIGDKPFVLPADTPMFGVGECVLSPALKAALATDVEAAARFCGGKGALIGPGGVRGPEELVGYVGVPIEQFNTDPNLRGGVAERGGYSAPEISTGLGALLVVVGALVPTLALLLAMAIRFSARRQERMVSALAMMGLSGTRLVMVVVGETAAVSLFGIAVGVAGWFVGARVSTRFWFGRARWFVSDTSFGVVGVMVVVGLFAVSLVLAIIGARSAVSDPLRVRRSAVSAASSSNGLIVVIVAACVCGWVWVFGLPTPDPDGIQGRQLLIAAVTVGQLMATPMIITALTRWFASRFASRARSPWLLLAARSVQWDSRTIGRVLGAAVVAAQITAISFLITSPGWDGSTAGYAKLEDRPIWSMLFASVSPFDQQPDIEPIRVSVNWIQSDGDDSVRNSGSVMLATCTDFAVVFGIDSSACANVHGLRVGTIGVANSLPGTNARAEFQGRPGEPNKPFTVPSGAIMVERSGGPAGYVKYWIDAENVNASLFSITNETFNLYPFDRTATAGPHSEQRIRSELAFVHPDTRPLQTLEQVRHIVGSNVETTIAVVNAVAALTGVLLLCAAIVGAAANLRSMETMASRLCRIGAEPTDRTKMALWQIAIGSSPMALIAGITIATSTIALARMYHEVAISGPITTGLGIGAAIIIVSLATFAATTAIAILSSDNTPAIRD